MSTKLRDEISRLLAPAIDMHAPYAKVMLDRIMEAIGPRVPPKGFKSVTLLELIKMLEALPVDALNLEVIISSQGETVQLPLNAQIEATCEEDEDGKGKDIVRLYTDNGERD